MRTALRIAAATMALTGTAVAEETRSAGAHEHGHGTFRMVIDGERALIELTAPAFDIVGFEHAPATAAQRTAIAEAAATLGRPDRLFAMPEAAGCVVGRIAVAFGAVAAGGGDHDGHDDDDHADHADDDHAEHDDEGQDHAEDDHADHAGAGGGHSEVRAAYTLACADPAALDRIDFAYFDAFAGAEELDVVVLSDAGQAAGEVSRGGTTFAVE